MLSELTRAAAVKRAARHRVADARADPGSAGDVAGYWAAHDMATARWVVLLREAAAGGHPVAVIARAAGITAASVHYRLQHPAPDPDTGATDGAGGGGISAAGGVGGGQVGP